MIFSFFTCFDLRNSCSNFLIAVSSDILHRLKSIMIFRACPAAFCMVFCTVFLPSPSGDFISQGAPHIIISGIRNPLICEGGISSTSYPFSSSMLTVLYSWSRKCTLFCVNVPLFMAPIILFFPLMYSCYGTIPSSFAGLPELPDQSSLSSTKELLKRSSQGQIGSPPAPQGEMEATLKRALVIPPPKQQTPPDLSVVGTQL